MTDDAAALSAQDDSILEQIADAVVYSDRAGTIRRWNRAAEGLFGHAAAEALGRSLDLIIPEPLRAAHWRGFNAAVASGVTRLDGRPALTRAVHASGRRLYVEMSFALVRDGAGEVVGSVAVARDVTERTEQQKARQGNATST
ncbi:MAG TPA: PAS domain S-box protein [Methyloversatilis sp.]